MCLHDTMYYRQKQDVTVQWRDDCFRENITDVSETIVMKKMMIVLANPNLLMTKSAIPVTLKGRWCYDNEDATTDFDLCTFDF